MARVLIALAALAAVFVFAGCEGDDSGDSGNTAAALGGELFTQTAHSGSLTAVSGQDNTFTLTLDDPAPQVTGFTDRPVRSASTEPLQDFVDSWAQRGFEDDPPNAALVLDEAPDDADTAVYTIADPQYDSKSGSVSYTATRIQSGTAALPLDEGVDHPETFGDAHLFIDPSGGETVQVAMGVLQSTNKRTSITLDPPWTVVLGAADEEVELLLAPNPGGATLLSQRVELTSGGDINFSATGGSGPLTGTATVPSGSALTLGIGSGPDTPVKNGKFSIPTGG